MIILGSSKTYLSQLFADDLGLLERARCILTDTKLVEDDDDLETAYNEIHETEVSRAAAYVIESHINEDISTSDIEGNALTY